MGLRRIQIIHVFIHLTGTLAETSYVEILIKTVSVLTYLKNLQPQVNLTEQIIT